MAKKGDTINNQHLLSPHDTTINNEEEFKEIKILEKSQTDGK